MKNKISNVHDALVEQLERLSQLSDKDDKPLSPDEVKREIERANAICKVSSEITKLNQLTIDAMRLLPQEKREMPKMLNG